MSKLDELGGLEAAKEVADNPAEFLRSYVRGTIQALIEHIESLTSERDALKKRVEELEHSWRCFRCGEVFTDRDKAAEHFNGDYCEDEEPWCQFVSRMEAAEKRVEELERDIEALGSTAAGADSMVTELTDKLQAAEKRVEELEAK